MQVSESERREGGWSSRRQRSRVAFLSQQTRRRSVKSTCGIQSGRGVIKLCDLRVRARNRNDPNDRGSFCVAGRAQLGYNGGSAPTEPDVIRGSAREVCPRLPSIGRHHHRRNRPSKNYRGYVLWKAVPRHGAVAGDAGTRPSSLISPFLSFPRLFFAVFPGAGSTWRPLTQTIIRILHDYRATGPTNRRGLNP